jgi:hypothetical protein
MLDLCGVCFYICDAFCSVENILSMQDAEPPCSDPEAPRSIDLGYFLFVLKLSYASRITCDTDLLHPTMA